jgi:hypothetical protein
MGKWGRTALALALLVAATGCSVPPVARACPAIAHSTVIPVGITGTHASSVAAVQICSDDNDCSSGIPVQAPQQPSATPSPPPVPPSSAAPTASKEVPRGPFAHFRTSQISHEAWQIETEMVQPAAVTAQALNSQGVVLATAEASLEWTRISGSEECGGNQRSTPILLTTS